MGYYIETSENFNKGEELIKLYGAKPISQPKNFKDIPEKQALIVVVNNGIFEAAGYVFDESEFQAFTQVDDLRPKRFLLMDLEKAQELCGFKLQSKLEQN